MTQEQFEKMRSLNEAITHYEGVLAKADHAHLGMYLCNGKPFQDYKDEVDAAYCTLITEDVRDYLTIEMRKRLKAAIQERINELKAEFKEL